MKRISFKHRLFLLLSLPFLCASCGAKTSDSENPPMQIEQEFPNQKPFPLPLPEPTDENAELSPPTTAPEIWDVSDVDTSKIDKTRKLISFTFDDAPKRTLENLLAVFASFNEENPDCPASATVFCNGYFFDATSKQTLHAALALGLELGNHTQSHLDLTKLDEQTLKQEIEQTDALLEKLDGKKRHLLRAPFGSVNELVQKTAQVPILDWTIDTLDWTNTDEQTVYDSVWNNRFSGAIVLMHDGYEHTVSALKRLLPDLKADGYQVVSVSQLSKAHACPLRRGSRYIRIRKKD